MNNFSVELANSNGRKIFADYITEQFESDEFILTFDKLTALYNEVNSVVNISALKTPDDIYLKHYLDSIYPYKFFSGSCCDVGCGGGFPTIPLAIVTDLSVTGVDSVGKKLMLIKRCKSELNLKNLDCAYARSEDLVKLRRSYDTVCARALADIDKALSFCAPLASPNGKIVLYRTQSDSAATDKTKEKQNVVLEETLDYILPHTDIKRRLFVYRKK